MKSCTIVVTNKGREVIYTHFRGAHEVTVLDIEVRDSETGRLLNKEISHSAERDTLTFEMFYDEARAKPRTEDQ